LLIRSAVLWDDVLSDNGCEAFCSFDDHRNSWGSVLPNYSVVNGMKPRFSTVTGQELGVCSNREAMEDWHDYASLIGGSVGAALAVLRRIVADGSITYSTELEEKPMRRIVMNQVLLKSSPAYDNHARGSAAGARSAARADSASGRTLSTLKALLAEGKAE
jgi:hypothetical protein